MLKAQESIGFAAVKALVEKAQQRPLDPVKTEKINGVEWRVLRLQIATERPETLPKSDRPVSVFLLASVYYRPKGPVDGKKIIGLRERNKRALLSQGIVFAAADGFTSDALQVFRRSKSIDYLSETHWPKDWPQRD